MTFVLIMGVGAIAAFFCLAGILAGILEHKACKKTITPIVEKTPEQIYNKCCYCPNYATCTKTLEEVIKC